MKRNDLGEDNVVCPLCHRCSMVEYEDDNIVNRMCTSCNYSYDFEKKEMIL